MSGDKIRTNPALILVTILLCLFFGIVLRQSSADPSPASSQDMPDTLIAENTTDAGTPSSAAAAVTPDVSESPQETPVPSETPTPTPAPTEAPAAYEVSPEAEMGTWTSSGSNWIFTVNGVPFTGWLTDTDGKRYYLNSEGVMQRGWIDDGGKRYYLNLDGVMQTGDITVDDETYHLLDDGSLEGYTAPVTETPAPEPTATPEPTAAPATEGEDASVKTTPAPDKTVALTFDDGPSSFTDRLLDCLEANNAKATFFMVGQEINNFPDAVRRMAELGCELGNHTYTHTDLTSLSPEDMTAEIAGTDELLVELTGNGASVVRPPYGSVDESVSATIGTPMILWSIDTLDWETLDPEQTIETVLSEVQDGSIILMHDIYETSVEAAEVIIPKLIEEGYELVTVHELAAAHGVELSTGIAYGGFTE